MRSLGFVAFLWLLQLLPGCLHENHQDDECSPSQASCVDNRTIRTCYGHTYLGEYFAASRWETNACPYDGFCVEGEAGVAFCALSPMPAPQCAAGLASFCFENQPATCNGAFAVAASSEHCTGICVDQAPGTTPCAFCWFADGPPKLSPKPLCAKPSGTAPTRVCDDRTLYECACGYALGPASCFGDCITPADGGPSVCQ